MKRRKFTPEFKAKVVLEVLTGIKSSAEACRDYQLHPQQLGRWKTHLLAQAATLFRTDSAQQASEQRLAELEQMVGRLTMELEIAKKASTYFNSVLSRNGR